MGLVPLLLALYREACLLWEGSEQTRPAINRLDEKAEALQFRYV